MDVHLGKTLRAVFRCSEIERLVQEELRGVGVVLAIRREADDSVRCPFALVKATSFVFN